MGAFKDITGQKFNRLTVIGLAKKRNRQGWLLWNCVCDCGKTTTATSGALNYGHPKSCGCLVKDSITGANNYQVRRTIEKYGQALSSDDSWYMRASDVLYRARDNKIPIDFDTVFDTMIYLKSIAPDKCPVFGKKFVEKNKIPDVWSPSVDKIDPRKGYVRGNIQIISYKANRMKQNATPRDLVMFAKWAVGEIGFAGKLGAGDLAKWRERVWSIRTRTRAEGIKFGFKTPKEFAEYLQAIAPNRCPVFNTKLSFGGEHPARNRFSVDRIDPKKGYVEGNLQIMSQEANFMKNDATQKELKQFGRWVLESN